jgi:hypothetical protein
MRALRTRKVRFGGTRSAVSMFIVDTPRRCFPRPTLACYACPMARPRRLREAFMSPANLLLLMPN